MVRYTCEVKLMKPASLKSQAFLSIHLRYLPKISDAQFSDTEHLISDKFRPKFRHWWNIGNVSLRLQNMN